jgi:transcriptional regulator with XRE-family HTH domain
MSREAFGPRLRRERLRQGISLEQISAETNIEIELLAALEVNDFSAWPSGIYARAYIRQYAAAVGIDVEETVNEFCRHFPQGDRRLRPLVVEHAAMIGYDTTWTDELPPELGGADRRGAPDAPPPPVERSQPAIAVMLARLRRAFGRA